MIIIGDFWEPVTNQILITTVIPISLNHSFQVFLVQTFKFQLINKFICLSVGIAEYVCPVEYLMGKVTFISHVGCGDFVFSEMTFQVFRSSFCDLLLQ